MGAFNCNALTLVPDCRMDLVYVINKMLGYITSKLSASPLSCDMGPKLTVTAKHHLNYISYLTIDIIQTESQSFELRLIGYRRDIVSSRVKSDNAVPSCCKVISLLERAK